MAPRPPLDQKGGGARRPPVKRAIINFGAAQKARHMLDPEDDESYPPLDYIPPLAEAPVPCPSSPLPPLVDLPDWDWGTNSSSHGLFSQAAAQCAETSTSTPEPGPKREAVGQQGVHSPGRHQASLDVGAMEKLWSECEREGALLLDMFQRLTSQSNCTTVLRQRVGAARGVWSIGHHNLALLPDHEDDGAGQQQGCTGASFSATSGRLEAHRAAPPGAKASKTELGQEAASRAHRPGEGRGGGGSVYARPDKEKINRDERNGYLRELKELLGLPQNTQANTVLSETLYKVREVTGTTIALEFECPLPFQRPRGLGKNKNENERRRELGLMCREITARLSLGKATHNQVIARALDLLRETVGYQPVAGTP